LICTIPPAAKSIAFCPSRSLKITVSKQILKGIYFVLRWSSSALDVVELSKRMIIAVIFLVIALLCVIALATVQHFRLGALDNELLEEAKRYAALRSENGNLSYENRELRAEISRLQFEAETDSLTGLPNRRAFEAALQKEQTRAYRDEGVVVFLAVDLDRFKEVNDTLGHAKGDKVLCAVANALHEVSRVYDLICRLGGDEFVLVLVLNQYSEAFVSERRNKLRSAIWNITQSQAGVAVGASIGVGLSLADADADLYRDKNRGEGADTVTQ
jgi:diguanylate cyclase (GGDEF)-like protein